MIWGPTDKEKRERETKKNANWFAWYPVKLEDGRWCWLQRVEREYWSGWDSSGYDYTRIT